MEGLFGTILVSAIILAIVAFIVVRMVKNKKAGKRSCGMGCSGCSQKQSCFIVDEKLQTIQGELDKEAAENRDELAN